MKKSIKKGISVGVSAITVASPVLNNAKMVLADTVEPATSSTDRIMEIDNTSVSLSNKTSANPYFAYDSVSKTAYVKGGTVATFKIAASNLKSPLQKIQLLKDTKVLLETSKEGEISLSCPLEDIPSGGSVKVRYKFKDGTFKDVVFYDYFKKSKIDLKNIVVDKNAPSVTLDDKVWENDTVHNDYHNGNLHFKFSYNKNKEQFNNLIPNVLGGNGYKFKLFVNGEDYAYNTKAWVVKANDNTGKLDITLNPKELLVAPNGNADIRIVIADNVGNETVFEERVKFDFTSPEIVGTLSTEFKDIDGTVHIKKGDEAIKINYTATDSESGVKKVTLIKDGQEYETTEASGYYTLTEGSAYSFKVEDNLGNEKTYKLSEVVQGLKDNFIFDKAPSISATINGEAIKDTWYKDKAKLVISFSDDKGLDNAKISINGEAIKSTINFNGNKSHEFKSDLATELANPSGNITIKCELTDLVGHVTTYNVTAKVDTSIPSIKNFRMGKINIVDGVGYANKDIEINGDIENSKSGVSKVEILRGNNVVAERLPYTITQDGSYSIRLTDNAGHIVTKTIGDLLGNSLANIKMDKVKPIINRVEGYNPKLSKDGVNWYTSVPTLKVNVEDDNLQSLTFKVNGKVTKEVNSGASNGIYAIPLESNKDGVYNVEVIAVDKAENTTKDTYTFNVDSSEPSLEKGTLSKHSDKTFGVFFENKPSVSVIGLDKNGIGIESYSLYNAEGRLLENNKTGVFELDNGEFFVKAVDKLGNESDLISLKDLFNLKSNKFIIDKQCASVEVSKPKGAIKGFFSTKNLSYGIHITDNEAIDTVKVYINDTLVNSYSAGSIVKELNLDSDISKVYSKDGEYSIRIEVKDCVGNSTVWRDSVKIDTTAPTIEKFIISGKGYKEGKDINGSDKYGFFIDGKTDIEVKVSDGEFSSGLAMLLYSLRDSNGNIVKKDSTEIVNGIAKIKIDDNFKGFISACAVDNVGNTGEYSSPDGIISEDGNTHINTCMLDISLPKTDTVDSNGTLLYNNDVTLTINAKDISSGLRSVTWGIGNDTSEKIEIDNNGKIVKGNGVILSTDKNLVTGISKKVTISGSKNAYNVWVKIEDRAGHISTLNRDLSIDKDKPVINVVYDNTEQDNYYSKTRKAKVTIKDRNFNPNTTKFSGVLDKVGNWSKVDESTWVCDLEFSNDNKYKWSLDSVDRAGNKADTYNSEEFVIDTTAPDLKVTFDNNSSENGNYYKAKRVATISIVDKNFDSSLVKLDGAEAISGWSSNGDTHTATVVFDKDGEYNLSAVVVDKAGNTSSKFNSGAFIIDTTSPELTVSGVQDGISYKKNISFKINMSDTNIDTTKSSFTLVGRSNGSMPLEGKIEGTSGELTFKGVSQEKVFDDFYTLNGVVYDKAGNSKEVKINFSINRYGSSYDFIQEGLLNNVVSEIKGIEIEETNVDRLDTNNYRIVVIKDGKEINIDKKYIRVEETGGGTGNWVYRYYVDGKAFTEDGKYQIQVFSKAFDSSENSSLTEEYTFIRDTTNPEVIISGIESNKTYKETSRKVNIEVRDLSGVAEIKALLNGKEVSLSEEDGMYTLVIPESSSKQSLSIEVVDKAGNKSLVEIKDVLISSNFVVSTVNNSLFKWISGSIALVVLFLLGVLFKKRKDKKDEESDLAKKHAKMYQDSITGSSSSSSSNSTLNR